MRSRRTPRSEEGGEPVPSRAHGRGAWLPVQLPYGRMIIRRVPTDFIVEELLSGSFVADLSPRGSPVRPHAVFRLSKTSLTTPEAASQLAAALKVPPSRIVAAGLKDKHARTLQHVSVTLPVRTPELLPRTLPGRNWSAELVGWARGPITAAAIDRNRFTIVIRDIAPQRVGELDRRAEQLAEPGADAGLSRTLLVVNYFGDQRFGSARHGAGFAAASLVRGDFEHALRLLIATPARKDTGKRRLLTRAAAASWGDWAAILAATPPMPERRPIERLAETPPARAGADAERFRKAFTALPPFIQSFCIEAFQSFLWNAVAGELVRREAADRRPMLVADDPFGPLAFLHGADVPPCWIGRELPLPSPEAKPIDSCRGVLESVLRDQGLDLQQLVIPGLRRPRFGAASRPLICRVERFSLDDPDPDDLGRPGRLKRTVRFDLPRGAYATVVLRALGQ